MRVAEEAGSGDPTPLQDLEGLSTLDEAARRRLLSRQTGALLAHTSAASVISTVGALVMVLALAPAVGLTLAYTWLAVKVVTAMPRFVIGLAWRRGRWSPAVQYELNRAVIVSLVVDAAVWGAAGAWCVWQLGDNHAILMLGVLSCVAMLATFGLQVQLSATAAYVAPIMLPMAVAFLARGDLYGLAGAGGALLVLVQTLVTGYASQRRVLREFVASERLRRALVDRSKALVLASETSENLQAALIEVQRQSAVKARFLSTMSHELRTPLHGILGLTELVLRTSREADARRKLGLVKSSAEHLLELIAALLDASRIDAGKLALHEAPFDLGKELRTIADLYAARAESKGIAFSSRIELPRACWARGDAGRLRQVLHNLLGNAIKFTQRGLVTLEVHEIEGGFRFEVGDTGTGIAAAELPHIFEPFRQTDETSARPHDGTGLGLSIAREIARAMGGDIAVSSAVGVGSRFVVDVRMARIAVPDAPAAEDQVVEPVLKRGLNVLIVEDNDVNALVAQTHLEHLGCQTTRARDGREAVDRALDAERPDLILMDWRMPLMDGPTASREIRRQEEERRLSRVPIIALSANLHEDDKADCLAAGMDGFLGKPFTSQQMWEALHAVQEGQAQRLRDHPLYDLALSLEDSDTELMLHGTDTIH